MRGGLTSCSRVEILNETVTAEIAALPADMQARFLRLVERISPAGLESLSTTPDIITRDPRLACRPPAADPSTTGRPPKLLCLASLDLVTRTRGHQRFGISTATTMLRSCFHEA